MSSVLYSINRYLFTNNNDNYDSNPAEIHEINIKDNIILISNTKIPPVPPDFPIDLHKKYELPIRCKIKYKTFNDYRKELKKKEKKIYNKQRYRKKGKRK